jgi:RNA polymerase sigma factor (sigma-70 family)
MDRLPEQHWWDETRAIARRQARGAEQPSDAADDLAQDLAVAVLEHGEEAVRTGPWLERVGRNARIDRWRVEHRRRELAGQIEAPPAPADPEAGVLARERRGVLRRALAALPRSLRRAALARFHAELPFGAVAARLGTQEVTARTRVHRALERLRERVGGLRVVLVPLPGAHAAALGLALVVGVARPAPVPVQDVAAPATLARAGQRGSVAEVAAPPAVAPATPPRVRPSPPQAAPPRATTAPAAVQRMSFVDDEIEVGVLRPDDLVVHAWVNRRPESLIELRLTLVPEIAKTLEEL